MTQFVITLVLGFFVQDMYLTVALYSRIFVHLTGVASGIFRRGLILPTRGLKYGFQGTIKARNLRKNRFSPSDGGLACSNGRTIGSMPSLGATPRT